jgi:site-specific DNA-methyltransferase (adenine-specific)
MSPSVPMRSSCWHRCPTPAPRLRSSIRNTGGLDRQKYGNEGARQKGRCALPQMTGEYIDSCIRETARVLRPLGYLMLWADTFNLCQAHHLRVADVMTCVDLIAWDNQRPGRGHRTRHRGSYLLVLQKPRRQRPQLVARATWPDRGIPDRWIERIIRPRSQHPHVKPIGLITRLIAATTKPGDLVVDPAAGGFGVLAATLRLGREFIGCNVDATSLLQLGAHPCTAL